MEENTQRFGTRPRPPPPGDNSCLQAAGVGPGRPTRQEPSSDARRTGPNTSSPTAAPPPAPGGLANQYRFVLVLLLALCNACLYICRANMSVAVVFMYPVSASGESVAGAALTLSAFYFGYPCFQLVGGHLAGVYGSKKVLGCGILLWSVFSILTVPAYKIALRGGGGGSRGASSTNGEQIVRIVFPFHNTVSIL